MGFVTRLKPCPDTKREKQKQKQKQILRLTTPRLKSTPGAPFAQDDKHIVSSSLRMTMQLNIVLSHPCANKKAQGWGTGLVGD